MKFVPEEQRNQNSPCRFIPLTEKRETIEHFYRYGTQIELEEALKMLAAGRDQPNRSAVPRCTRANLDCLRSEELGKATSLEVPQ